ncbi:hypothetical protein [Candidatus Amarolinea dominans]|uniref:hypothetical protein n=1 Tax=Candidatus Amarolinea dominans TaxID=3140696 RepID=UPI001DFC67B1|nr:hypothetical protein [Anaerolineae bacterium]MBK9231699.1 hypothetical protein [Anaerolineae bacterium]
MNITFNKIASALAFLIGVMAIFAGGQVLLGKDPGYHVINWLVLYNYTIGILTVFTTAVLIWTQHKYALPAAIGTLGVHALVMLIIQTAYRGVVASDSLRAMTIRIVVWLIILTLMFVGSRRQRPAQA